jgi:hypothetical protein
MNIKILEKKFENLMELQTFMYWYIIMYWTFMEEIIGKFTNKIEQMH